MPSQVLTIVNQPSRDAPASAPGSPKFWHADPSQAQVSALDLGVTRGDGIFETLSIGDGHPQALDHHLSRFAKSAAMLDLSNPDLELWREVILATAAALDPVPEAWVKTVMTRGVEGGDALSGWAFGSPSADFTRDRTEGVRVVLLDRGYRHDVEQTSPWLLAGAKTLSYAINRASVREAVRRGADDVIFVSSDGIVLEGPTSTVVYRRGDELLTPGTGLGILDGTTQANVFRYAESRGMPTAFELTTPDILRASDAAWLVSSVRHFAPVRAIDGHEHPIDADFTADVNAWLRTLRR